MSNPSAALSATLADEFRRCGLRHIIVAPGSRSTPMALAMGAEPALRTDVVLDERSAGYVALGVGLASGMPAAVVTTSGTAAAELHAAVVEAHHAQVPLLVCTADRPPELQDVGSPQTITQGGLYPGVLRWSADLGAADPAAASAWRSMAARAVAMASGAPAGPVHLNLPFREPLVGEPGPLPEGRPDGAPWHRRVTAERIVPPALVADLAARWAGRRGVIVAGAGVDAGHAPGVGAGVVLTLAERLGWPVLADPRSGCRVPHPFVVAHADGLLRSARFVEEARPEVVLQLGAPHASKVLAQWLAASGAERVAVDRAGTWWDPERQLALLLEATIGPFAAALAAEVRRSADEVPRPAGWAARWRAGDDAAAAALAGFTGRHVPAGPDAGPATVTEPEVAALLAARVGPGEALVVSSSMPVRDVEWYAPRRAGLRVLANRGANGIDGVVSTAVGVALASRPAPVWLLIGDLALLHDRNGLLGAARRPLRLRLVVVDNDGGGIFSFLPQAGAVSSDTFERFFGTPQGVDLAAMLTVEGVEARSVCDRAGLEIGLAWLAAADAPVATLVVRTDRAANVAAHDLLHERMVAGVEATLAI